jgi:dUTP pyrophosphatase
MAVIADSVECKLLHPAARLPERSRSGDAGYDLRCVDSFTLWSGERALVPTGVAIALPAGLAGMVLPRSGLAHRHGVTCLNSPGLVDPNYRGELKVVLINHGAEPFHAQPGDRIAQLLLVPFLAATLVAVGELPPGGDSRGEAGFGSSGR